jgi:ABC-type sugar transport system substrate-binding protein
MKTGAEDAGKDFGVAVEVFGDPSFDTHTHQAFFTSALQEGFDGIAVVTLPGDKWTLPIQQAVDQGVPVVGANVPGLKTAMRSWVGQDDYKSGVILGDALRQQFEAAEISEGKIAVGNCSATSEQLQERDAGLRKAFESTDFEVLPAQGVLISLPDNYASWENIMTANPDAVGVVGLCSMDIPNLALLKQRTGGTWLIGGYDLDPATLQAVQDGWAQVTVDEQEYLQGYLPVRALAEHLINGTPLVDGWLETPTEVVTIDNVADYVSRQTDDQVQHEYYLQYMKDHFADLQAAARPYDDLRHPGMARATPEA